MKKILGITLALALALGATALAETLPETQPTAIEEQMLAIGEGNTQAEDPEAPEEPENGQTALKKAIDAYRAAKQEKALSDLETELAEYVTAGSMTQEQADLILNSVKERIAEKNGECPNCGYQFARNGKDRQEDMNNMPGNRQHGQRFQMRQNNDTSKDMNQIPRS